MDHERLVCANCGRDHMDEDCPHPPPPAQDFGLPPWEMSAEDRERDEAQNEILRGIPGASFN